MEQASAQGRSEPPKTVLLVDEDDDFLALACVGLREAGYRVLPATTWSELLEGAQERPTLALVHGQMRQFDGHRLGKLLKQSHEAIRVVMTANDRDGSMRRLALESGFDGFVNRPSTPAQVVEEVRRHLGGDSLLTGPRSPEDGVGRDAVHVGGHLSQLGPGTVLTMLNQEGETGLLLMTHGDRVGRLWLRDGQVVDGELVANGMEMRGVDAAYRLLGWKDGTFSFKAQPVSCDDAIELPLQHLVLEGARLADEGRRDS